MKYHSYFFHKLGKMLQNLSSAAVTIDALRVKYGACSNFFFLHFILNDKQSLFPAKFWLLGHCYQLYFWLTDHFSKHKFSSKNWVFRSLFKLPVMLFGKKTVKT